MKMLRCSSGGLLFLVLSFWSHGQLRATQQVDKERIDLGMQAAKSAQSALEATECVPWAAKIAKVAGPILTAVSIVLDIELQFVNTESPEMILMKAEFKNLSRRLDAKSAQFREVKNKIDWSAVQVSYQEKHDSAILALGQAMNRITQAKNAVERDEWIEDFKSKFENNFHNSTQTLYQAMTKSSALFDAAANYTDQHPELSLRFMQGCTQLLLQAISIQGTYIHLKYNSTAADEQFQKLSNEMMTKVAESSKKYYDNMKRNWFIQMKQDVNRLTLENRGISHNNMSKILYHYLQGKYIDRIWFVISYNELWTYENHGVMVCGGSINFRTAGRNIVVASQDKNYKGFSVKWAKGVLNSIKEFRADHDGAKAVMNRVLHHQKRSCHPASAVAVVKSYSEYYYSAPKGHHVKQDKTVKWCNTDLCWVTKMRRYTTIIFG